ncbi:MAG: HEAT repeat domain-containing protein [Planctomycetota bacterium]|jgi:HEAT repeat protein
MKNKNKKNYEKKTKLTKLFATLAIIICAMLCLGCQESTQTRTDWPTPTPSLASAESLLPEATRIIQAALADPDPLTRVNAIEVVAIAKRSRLIPKVQKLLKDDYVPIRFAATLAIGDLEYSLAKKPINAMLQDTNVNVRMAAIYTLYKLDSKDRIQQIRKAIASNDQTVRANAALLLGKSGDKSELTKQVLWWSLRRPDSGDMVRFQIAESLAMLGDERIYPKLWAMLISKYADDRVMGIKAMGALKTLHARDALATMLDDNIVEVRLAAAEQLGGTFKDPVGEPVVLDVLRKNLAAGFEPQGRERINIRTVLAIGRIGTPSLTAFLPGFLKDASKKVRMAAAMAVFQTQTK